MKDMTRIRAALRNDRTIDIVTTGAKTQQPRSVEIWFMNIDDRIVICGTPAATADRGPRAPRGWLANLIAQPAFEFKLKESVSVSLPAVAAVVRNRSDRTAVMTAPETVWYREQGFTIEELIENSPIVDVKFTGPYACLNRGG